MAALIEGAQPPRHPRPRRGRCAFQACVAFFVLPASLLVALFLALVLYQIVFLDRIFVGVYAMGVDLGGMTRAQAAAALSAPVDAYLRFPVTLQYQDRTWTITARQAGAALDVPRMIGAAYAIGHHGDLPGNVMQQLQALQVGVEVETAVRYDSGPANTVLTQIAQMVDRPARDAQLIIQPDMQVVAVPAQSGWAVDIDATRAALHQRAMDRDTAPVSLVVRETPPSVTEVEEARQRAGELLNGPLTMSFASTEETIDWTLSPAQLADMLLISEEVTAEGTGRVTLAFDKAKWLAFLNPLAKQVERAPVDARLEIDPTTRALRALRPSQPGQTLDVEVAWQMVANLLVQPSHHVDLPGRQIPAAVAMEEAGRMGLTDVVAEAVSSFKGSSEARVRNIQVAASKFHGVVVPPGAIFSFNEYLGAVTAENGFEDSLIIWGDRTAVGIGGGVCQVSTTAFRAAFFGGFEILERWAHGYRVSWYEIDAGPGLDATIYAPDVDFKFRNDTDGFLLIQTYTDVVAGTVTFRFYGTPTNRRVTMEGPLVENESHPAPPLYQDDPSLPKGVSKQVEWAKDGADVTVKRTVTQGDAIIHQDIFVSRYRPWRALYLVGTGGVEQPTDREATG